MNRHELRRRISRLNPFAYRTEQARGYGVSVNPYAEAIVNRKVGATQNVVTLIRSIIRHERPELFNKEHMWAIGIDAGNNPVFAELVSLGTLNYNLVHPRETFRTAVVNDIPKLIVAHNHPSGTAEPSDEDITLTKRLKQVGKVLGVELVKHLIITKTKAVEVKV